MTERRAKVWLLAAVVWLIVLAVLAIGYRFLIHPRLAGRLREATSSPSQYREEVALAADSFSGYAILRSAGVREELKARQIRLSLMDDKADYPARLQALRDGRVQMAVFTLDSLIAAGSRAGDFPCSIVWVIDETTGGDAIVAYKSAVRSLQDLDDPAARLVLTPASPSEFLARVMLANFNVPGLTDRAFIPASGPEAVLAEFRKAGGTARKAFVLWEPYVSRALIEPGAHVLLDSSQVRGYIVDVLVAERAFLRDRPETVQAVVEAYARAAYVFNQQSNGLVKLVQDDARQTGITALDDAQAAKVVQGIQWKNTLENYAHFSLTPSSDRAGLPTLEDMIGNVVEVLIRTGALSQDPLAGRHNTLFFDRILAGMRDAGFHPGKAWNASAGVDAGASREELRSDRQLAALTEAQWSRLRPVGELRTAPIAFQRASAALSLDAGRALEDLARRLQSFPRFYVRVIGQARAEGDPNANRDLAQQRADSVAQALSAQGIAAQRIRTAAEVHRGGGEAQAVRFEVGQVPY